MKKYNTYPKRDAMINYFSLPNEIFNLVLSAGEIAVYVYLLRCENRETFQCYPSYSSIGEAVNISANTVKNTSEGCVKSALSKLSRQRFAQKQV